MLWIALHLPLLSLESFVATLPAGEGAKPLVLMGLHHITAANEAAQALGVKPGLKRATALALAPQLVQGQADPARDAQALTAVAHAALAFTPVVALQPAQDRDAPADTALLEVHASLRCFGGLKRLVQQLSEAIAPLGHALQIAIAPTAQGAALLARVHARLYCADPSALQRALDAAPVWLLGPGREHWDALQGMGLQTLAELRRLPRAGLARRSSEGLLDELDRAYGTRPDPREPIVLPPRFESRLELFARADTTEQVLHGAAMLLARLVAWLSAQHAFVRRFVLVMKHEPRWRRDAGAPAATPLAIALAEPSRDAAHLRVLLRERLTSLPLPAPTLELVLQADDIAQRAPPNTELFPTPRSEREGLVRLIERLQARLGPQRVNRLVCVADHRPERASRVEPADPAQPAPRARATPAASVTVAAVRPVWLLAPPEPLRERGQRPLLDGRELQLLSGPERIESGWWDQALAERDYFIAQAGDGALVWVYRARLPATVPGTAPGWFLHGRFG